MVLAECLASRCSLSSISPRINMTMFLLLIPLRGGVCLAILWTGTLAGDGTM